MPAPVTPADGIVWITGASSGIGRALALELAQRGWTVAATARNAGALDLLAAQAPNGRIRPFAGDVTDAGAIAELIATVERQLGPIALAFLNAGISIHNRAPDMDVVAATRIFSVNVLGSINAAWPLIGQMARRGRGQIAFCGSVAGYGGLPYAAAYCASKAAIINASVSLAIECAPLGIRIQCVNPGFVDTPLTRKNDFPMPFIAQPEQAARWIAEGLASRRFEITFPRRLAWPMKLLNLLPYRVYIAAMRWGIARNRRQLPMSKER